ncbi:MAG: MoxR family ATPase [Acidobacteriota bacterium]
MTELSIQEAAHPTVRRLENALRQGVQGQDSFLRGLLVALLANGHVLIEGVPGLGKTRAVHLLARHCQVWFQRVQFTPDLLPADILGTRIYNQQSGQFETVQGPAFTNFLLADEINRAPAKVQSALLETMQERQITIGQESIPVPRPFLVFATQNPVEQEGTYPLPEAQLDRFLVKLQVEYPRLADEVSIVQMVIDETEMPMADELVSRQQLEELQAEVRGIFIEERLVDYATRLVRATRDSSQVGLSLDPFIELGASPRGSISLVQAARATALIAGRDAVIPDDLKAVAPDVLRHRIVRTYIAEAEAVTCDQMIAEILSAVRVP